MQLFNYVNGTDPSQLNITTIIDYLFNITGTLKETLPNCLPASEETFLMTEFAPELLKEEPVMTIIDPEFIQSYSSK